MLSEERFATKTREARRGADKTSLLPASPASVSTADSLRRAAPWKWRRASTQTNLAGCKLPSCVHHSTQRSATKRVTIGCINQMETTESPKGFSSYMEGFQAAPGRGREHELGLHRAESTPHLAHRSVPGAGRKPQHIIGHQEIAADTT